MISDAVGLERRSRIVGYKLTTGNFSEVSPNLPQRIAVFAEANTANQGTLDTDARQLTTAKRAGELYGYGSPIYTIMRILKPTSGSGVGGIPIYVYPQAEAPGASAKVIEIEASGVATGNATHTLKVCGRTGLDGVFYDINISEGDSASAIHAKIEDAINSVLGSPVSAESTDYEATLTTKWKGLTANDVNVEVITTNDSGKDVSVGISYSVTTDQAGSGTPSIAGALSQFGDIWNTIVVNSYGTVSSIMTALEQFNGIPDPENPTGRFTGIIMKPFFALTGSVAEDPSSITDSRKEDVTIAICPAPLSKGLPMEAAANMTVLFAVNNQNTPHLDVAGRTYPDMPVPTGSIGAMANYDDRDAIVKKGCSTVDISAGRYRVQDFVTTYHPDGENPPQFGYCRNLVIDTNVYFDYYLQEQINVVDHVIAADNDIVSAPKVVKPKQWKGILFKRAESLASRALIVEPDFMQASIQVGIGTSNPDRMETFFRYKRSGFVRIASTTAEAGFNYGNV
jgi:phage tail sheath gpL-like